MPKATWLLLVGSERADLLMHIYAYIHTTYLLTLTYLHTLAHTYAHLLTHAHICLHLLTPTYAYLHLLTPTYTYSN